MGILQGNVLIAQSGGPTAVINSTVCGVIQRASQQSEIENIYGAYNGILGVLQEDLLDVKKESADTIEALKWTPAAAFGSCRYKLKDLSTSKEDYNRILEIFKAHNIRYFFYNGGNDSMDTASKVKLLATEQNYELRVIGCAKTVDNDLAYTDHCPGFGSVAKYIAVSTMEAGVDNEALYTTDTCTILETMGRNAGWIAGSAGLARREKGDAPHLIYLPEVPFSIKTFVQDVKDVLQKHGRVFIVVSEGVRDESGNYIVEQTGEFAKDSFGHVQLGGAGDVLQRLVEKHVGIKARFNKAGTNQRSAIHYASTTDRDEAYLTGKKAVEYALEGKSGYMVALKREAGPDYVCATSLVPLEDVANGEKKVPREWINEKGSFVTQEFLDYVRPLIQGDVKVPYKDGLPHFARLQRIWVDKKLPVYTLH